MTTVAIKDGVIAADTRMSANGGLMGYTSKLAVSKDGWLAGAAGQMWAVATFLEWVKRRALGPAIKRYGVIKSDPIENWITSETGALLLSPQGDIYIHQGKSPVRVQTPFVAEGSGREYAIGAMQMGASARDAVWVAMQWDAYTSGSIEEASISDPVVKKVTR